MKKFYLLFLVVLFSLFGLLAEAATMVVPGRTWWYESWYRNKYGSSHNDRHPVYLGLRLGDEYQGENNEWLPCYAVNTLGDKALEEPLAWVSEEDKKVWMIPNLELYNAFEIPGNGDITRMLFDFLAYWAGTDLFWGWAETTWTNLPPDTPYLLYDFNFEVGDGYLWPWSGMFLDDSMISRVYNTEGCYVKSVNEETFLSDTNRKVYHIQQDFKGSFNYPTSGGTIIEGIGIVNGEFWYYVPDRCQWFGFWIAPLSPGNPMIVGDYADLPYDPELVNVLEADGTCIYGNAAFNPALASATVTENKIWDYNWMQIGSSVATQPANGYHFSGTKMLNGQTYSIYRDGEENEVAYLRQDGDKVYLCATFPESSYGFSVTSKNSGGQSQTEYLLYDFGCQPGEKFMTVGFSDNGSNAGQVMEVEVLKNEFIRDKGFARHKLTLNVGWNGDQNGETFTILEGIGPEWGLLCAPQFGVFADSGYPKGYKLMKVAMPNWVLFNTTFGAVEVEEIAAEQTALPADNRYYNLMGRPVANPQPGTIYIRDGKKVILR